MYDVCIVGAGPAGATLARMIGQRYRVLLVDRRRFDEPAGESSNSKPCGGLLAPKAQRELASQGLGLPGSVIVGPQLFAVRALDLQSGLERTYQRFYVNVDRELFDRWLISLLPSAVDTALGYQVRGIDVGCDDSLVRLKTHGGGEASVAARLVVGADGAMSAVRRLAFPERPRPTRYAAMQGAFSGVPAASFYGAIFDRSLTDFYGWTIPKGGVTIAGIAASSGDAMRETFGAFISKARSAGFLAGEELSRKGAIVVRPQRGSDLLCGERGVALVGEAAGFVSPSSAEGISYALKTARLLAGAMECRLAGATERYAASALGIRADIGLRHAKSAAIYSAQTRRILMASRLGTMRVPPDGAPQPQWADTLGF